MPTEDCEYLVIHEEPLWRDRRIVDRVMYPICLVRDVKLYGECPYPALYCELKEFEAQFAERLLNKPEEAAK